MSSRFCTQCGAKLFADARFCAGCGHRVGGATAAVTRRFPVERWAPALVVGTVVTVAGLAIVVGVQHAAPPNVPPPRASAGAGQQLPEGHPQVELPDDVRKVIAKLADAAKKSPDDVPAWQQLGFVQYRAGQIDPAYLADAEATYTHILEREPENLDALRALGNVAFDRNDPARATEYYRQYLRLKPDDLSVQTDLGTMLLSTQQVEAALKAYKDVLAVDPKFFQAQFNLAIAYRTAGDPAQALAALEHARELAPDDPTRQRVDALVAHLKEESGTPGAAEASTGGADMHADIEAIFRGHPIVGPKIERIEWPSADHVRVVLRDFPMDGMPPVVRERFLDRIRSGLRDAGARHAPTAPPVVELVDAGSDRVMETVAAAGAENAPAPAAPPAPAVPGAAGDLHADVEAIFRAHPIVGPKLDRIDWPAADHARVLLTEFPMDAMPPMVRTKFTDRVRSGIRDAKAQHGQTAPVTVDLVDAASGRVMETVSE
jgi:cytochrome c-type biogenesis protein CcmH/NrfG